MTNLHPMASHVLRDMTEAYRARMEQAGEVFSASATHEEIMQEAMRDAIGAAGLKSIAEAREHYHEFHDDETRPPHPEDSQ